MSIEVEGVKGYEYQYLATLYLALLYIEKESVEIYVEDTEDARISFISNENKVTLYIQSKKHDSSISFSDVCSWLGHFGERQANVFLLSRVLTDHCFAVFISSGRCQDRVSNYICHENFEHGNTGTFSVSFAKEIELTLLNQYKTDTPLGSKRHARIAEFFQQYSSTQLVEGLKKISISEQVTNNNLSEKISQLLNKKYVIGTDSLPYVEKLLDECIRKGRDTGEDIVPQIRNILKRHSQKILPDTLDYIEVPNQSNCEALLSQKHILLLTGVPFCGKTSLAKSIAQNYAQQGYQIKQTSELDGENGAFSFFCNYFNGKKLLLLEDPLGAVYLKSDKVETLQKIRKLLSEHASSDSKIIITTRKDILLEAFEKPSITACSINDNCWQDQTMNDIEFACKVWGKLYGESIESTQYFETLKSKLFDTDDSVFFEIGEIKNLQRIYPSVSDLQALDINKVVHEARTSSQTIMEKIKAGGVDSINTFLALGFSCNTIRPISLTDLAYILSDAKELPSLINRDENEIRCISIGGEPTPTPNFPQYKESYRFAPSIAFVLQQFEQQGLIFRNQATKEVYFSHPIFYYASKFLLLDILERAWECSNIVQLGSRSIGALNKNSSLCALDALWYCIENNSNFKEDMLALMFLSLKSIFPATKDKAVLLLENRFQELSEAQQGTLVKAIKDYEFDKYLLWHNDEPFINPNSKIEFAWDFSTWYNPNAPLSIEDIDQIKSKSIPSKLVYDILNSNLKNSLSLNFLNIALQYDESFIREKAIYLIFKNHSAHIEVSRYLISFDHGNVIYALFRGALESWHTYSKESQEEIIMYFCQNLSRVSVAFQAQNFLETFGDDYHSCSLNWQEIDEQNRIELWTTWCIVFTQFFLKFPPQYLSMDEAHMDHTTDLVIKYVRDQNLLIDLFAAWNTWLTHSHYPTDYGMSVMEKLLRYTPVTAHKRQNLFLEMLSIENTSIITSHVRHIVDNWSYTSGAEKQSFFNLLSSNRADLIWIKAVAITRKSVSAEIQLHLFDSSILDKPVVDLIAQLRSHNLLEACLNVHCGYPQPLWYNGYHHSNYKTWDAVISEILLQDTIDQSFEISLREFVDDEYNYIGRFCNQKKAIWTHILETDQKRKRVFFWLLNTSATQNQTNKDIWDQYFNSCSKEELQKSSAQIAEFIEALEYWHFQDGGILTLFDSKVFFTYVYPLLKYDSNISSLCQSLLNCSAKANELSEDILQMCSDLLETTVPALYETFPPRMHLTNNYVRYTAKKVGHESKQLTSVLELQRHKLIDIACEMKKSFDTEYVLQNWII